MNSVMIQSSISLSRSTISNGRLLLYRMLDVRRNLFDHRRRRLRSVNTISKQNKNVLKVINVTSPASK